jgi:hypothetical protein
MWYHLGMEMSPHTTQAIGVVERYFGSGAVPTIAQQFTPGRGWRPRPLGEWVSRPLVRALGAEGVTAVALAYDGRLADFRVQELLTAAPAPVNRTVR